MNERKKLILIGLIFIVIMAAGVWAYQTFGNGLSSNLLMTEAPEAQETEAPASETALSSGETSALKETETNETDSAETTESAGTSEYLAPDFTFYDADGNEYALSDFFGKPIVLNFWSSTCPPCTSEMPEFQEVYEEMGEDVTFLMMDCVGVYIGTGQETKEKALSFIEEEGLTLPVYFDTSQNGIQTYGLSSFPTTFFIAANGDLVTYGMGALNKATLEKGISMITE